MYIYAALINLCEVNDINQLSTYTCKVFICDGGECLIDCYQSISTFSRSS